MQEQQLVPDQVEVVTHEGEIPDYLETTRDLIRSELDVKAMERLQTGRYLELLKSSSFNSMFFVRELAWLETWFETGNMTLSSLIQKCLTRGEVFRAVNFFSSDLGSVLLHHYTLMKLCLELTMAGKRVMVVEGCSSSLRRIVDDIDLIYMDGEEITYCDVYNSRVPEKSFVTPSCSELKSKEGDVTFSRVSDKLVKLNDIKVSHGFTSGLLEVENDLGEIEVINTTVKVIGLSWDSDVPFIRYESEMRKTMSGKEYEYKTRILPKVELILDVKKSHLKNEFDDEFSKVDGFLNLLDQITITQAENCLEAVSNRLIRTTIAEEGLVGYSCKRKNYFQSHKEEIVSAVKENTITSASTFENFMNHIKADPNGEPARKIYCEDFYERMVSQDIRPQFQFPRVREFGKDVSNDPFTRAQEILDILKEEKRDEILNGCVSSWLFLASKCQDDQEHPTKEEMPEYYAMCHNCPDYLKFTMKRLRKKGKKVKRTRAGKSAVRQDRSAGELIKAVKIRIYDPNYRNMNELAYGDLNSSVPEVKSRVSQMRHREVDDYTEMEERLRDEYLPQLTREVPDDEIPRHCKIINGMIHKVMRNNKVGKMVRDQMASTLSEFKSMYAVDLTSTFQDLCQSVEMMVKKAKLIENKEKQVDGVGYGWMKGKLSCMSVECVGHRRAISFTNISLSQGSHGDSSVKMVGDLDKCLSESLMRRCQMESMATHFHTINAPQKDWGVMVLPKLLTYCSMRWDTHFSIRPRSFERPGGVFENPENEIFIKELKSELCFAMLMMTLNSSNFAQASEMVRYIFVNTTGISNGMTNLFDKIKWYVPRTFVEKLYMLRMLKMANFTQLCKANKNLVSLVEGKSFQVTTEKGPQTVYEKSWCIAFPHENISIPADSSTYNNFYVCKALSIVRHQVLVSEALVFLKQLENRKKFDELRKKPLEHELRSLKIPDSPESLLNDIATKSMLRDPEDKDKGKFRPNYYTILLSIMASARKHYFAGKFGSDSRLGGPDECTIGAMYGIMHRNTDFVYNKVRLSHIMNSRGSVKSCKAGPYPCMGNLEQTIKRRSSMRAGKKDFGANLSKMRQSSKCYVTTLENVKRMVDSIESGVIPNMMVTKEVLKTKFDRENTQFPTGEELTDEDLSKVMRTTDSAWTVMAFNLLTGELHVARCVHKDQIGTREIGVMNSAMRISALFIEDLARQVQDNEQTIDDMTNLIEHPKKDDEILKSYDKARKSHKDLTFDNADCSTWGPSMLSYVLYTVLGARVQSRSVREILKMNFMKFSQKVLKIPDNLFKNLMSELETMKKVDEVEAEILSGNKKTMSKVLKAYDVIHKLEPELNIGNKHRQFLFAEEGMLQGILGSTSSLLAADSIRLSNALNEKVFRAVDLKVIGHVTSDDSCRILMFDSKKFGEEEDDNDDQSTVSFQKTVGSVMELIKGTLYIHVLVLEGLGIKRNMEKSVHSEFVLEFNSKFITDQGVFDPEIKGRMSYVDYSPQYDMVDSAVNGSEKSLEFLRKEGSVVGSCWVAVLNNYLTLMQHQNVGMYEEIRERIYQLPLELGGLIRPDPILGIVSHKLTSRLQNYGMTIDWNDEENKYEVSNVDKALAVMNGFVSTSEEDVSLDWEDSSKSVVPRMSRSGLINLCRRDDREKRQIRDFLKALPSSEFEGLTFGILSFNIIRGLIHSLKRETLTGSLDSPSDKFSTPQLPKNAKIFRVNCPLIKDIAGDSILSKLELRTIAQMFLSSTMEDNKIYFRVTTETGDKIFNSNLKPGISSEVPTLIKSDLEVYLNNESRLESLRLVPNNRISKKIRIRQKFLGEDSVRAMKTSFRSIYLPKEFGGQSSMSPLSYIETESLHSNKVDGLAMRYQNFTLSTLLEDYHLPLAQKLLRSNFMEGSSLEFDIGKGLDQAEYNHAMETINALREFSISIGPDMVKQINEAKSYRKGNSLIRPMVLDPLHKYFGKRLDERKVSGLNLSNICNMMWRTDRGNLYYKSNHRIALEVLERIYTVLDKDKSYDAHGHEKALKDWVWKRDNHKKIHGNLETFFTSKPDKIFYNLRSKLRIKKSDLNVPRVDDIKHTLGGDYCKTTSITEDGIFRGVEYIFVSNYGKNQVWSHFKTYFKKPFAELHEKYEVQTTKHQRDVYYPPMVMNENEKVYLSKYNGFLCLKRDNDPEKRVMFVLSESIQIEESRVTLSYYEADNINDDGTITASPFGLADLKRLGYEPGANQTLWMDKDHLEYSHMGDYESLMMKKFHEDPELEDIVEDEMPDEFEEAMKDMWGESNEDEILEMGEDAQGFDEFDLGSVRSDSYGSYKRIARSMMERNVTSNTFRRLKISVLDKAYSQMEDRDRQAIGSQPYTLLLPISTGKLRTKAYYGEYGNYSPMSGLLDRIEEVCDEDQAFWVKSYIRQCIDSNHELKMIKNNILSMV